MHQKSFLNFYFRVLLFEITSLSFFFLAKTSLLQWKNWGHLWAANGQIKCWPFLSLAEHVSTRPTCPITVTAAVRTLLLASLGINSYNPPKCREGNWAPTPPRRAMATLANEHATFPQGWAEQEGVNPSRLQGEGICWWLKGRKGLTPFSLLLLTAQLLGPTASLPDASYANKQPCIWKGHY